MSAEFALRVSGLTKQFGGLAAVDRLDFDVVAGERRGVIGPNGAGKTTLFGLISGELRATTGSVLLLGSDVTGWSPHRRARHGLGRTYQITNLFQRLTVRENVMLAAMPQANVAVGFRRSAIGGKMADVVDSALGRVGLAPVAERAISSLSHGEQRQVEVAMALAGQPKVLLFDEPGAGLSAAERAIMAEIIAGLPRDLTICLIEHDMDLALGLVDTVTCLHVGAEVVTGTPDEIRADSDVQAIYLGD